MLSFHDHCTICHCFYSVTTLRISHRAFIGWLLFENPTMLSFGDHCEKIPQCSDALRLRQNGRQLPDDIFKCIFLNENVWILIKISPKFVPKGPINNIPSLVQIMAWRHPGDKPLSEPLMVSLLMHICVSRPQWVNLVTSVVASDDLMAGSLWSVPHP